MIIVFIFKNYEFHGGILGNPFIYSHVFYENLELERLMHIS